MDTDAAAQAVVDEMLRQNPMLVPTADYGLFDDCDNKLYECRQIAEAANSAAGLQQEKRRSRRKQNKNLFIGFGVLLCLGVAAFGLIA